MPVPKGKRFGGKPKGYKAPQTLEKQEQERQFRERIAQHIAPLAEALVESARGVQHMMAREKDGKWTEVTDPRVMERVLNSGESFYKLSARKPDVNALRECFDRLFGRAAQAVDLTVKTDPKDLSDEDLDARVRELLDKLKPRGRQN